MGFLRDKFLKWGLGQSPRVNQRFFDLSRLSENAIFFLAAAFFAAVFIVCAPVRRVELTDETGAVALSFPVYLGDSFSTEYIHSVQLCPIVDVYYVIGDSVWLWEGRTQSTNAGIQTEAPRLGRFIHDPPWYRYIGGRRALKSFRMRVGNAKIGRNVITLPAGERLELYSRFTGRVLTLRPR